MFKICFVLVLFSLNACESNNRYLLFHRRRNGWVKMNWGGRVPRNLWNFDGDVKLLIHGYNHKLWLDALGVLEKHLMNILAKEYANFDDNNNIIAVDWHHLATYPVHEYPRAVANVKPAGRDIADYILNLWYAGSIRDFNKVHLLGLSMGAHVAGAAGQQFQMLTGGKELGRITGFDPAGPLFSTPTGQWPEDMTGVLDRNDAKFVDIIHTNAGRDRLWQPILQGRLGTDLITGHIDLIPNGGETQPDQCFWSADGINLCSHQMSVLFYALALRQPLDFIGCPCGNLAEYQQGRCRCSYPGNGRPIGELNSPRQNGKYFLTITRPLSEQDFQFGSLQTIDYYDYGE